MDVDRAALYRARVGVDSPPDDATTTPSLVSICRNVIVTYLEQYTPESFAICDMEEWEQIVRLRFRTAQPKRFMTSRIKEVLHHKLLAAIEAVNPHLDGSPVTDRILWQDCVDLTFPQGGATRPRELYQPWPVLVQHLTTCWALHAPPSAQQELDQMKLLHSITWNVALLRDTGLGKAVKHAVKQLAPGSHRDDLQQLLEAWKRMAAEPDATQAVYIPPTWTSQRDTTEIADDLQRAERATTWKELFCLLQERKSQRQAAQGARMRSRRHDAAQSRPKLVKVRPAKAAVHIKESSLANVRMTALRNEVRQQASHLAVPKTSTKASFGDAVAFCSVSQKGQKRKKGMIQQLGNGKQIKIPATGGGKLAAMRSLGTLWKQPPPPPNPKK
jgi:hypothetical protein